MTCKFLYMSLLFALPLAAAVKLADPFAEGMVLQRGMPVPVWGTAEPGEKVTVTFAGERVEAVTGSDGRWLCRLPPLKMSKESRELVATVGNSKQIVGDVLVGDVWFVSGQSNCEFPLCSDNPHFSDRNGAAIASITHLPLVRYCYQSDYKISAVPKTRAALPVKWRRFEPKNLLSRPSFSAIGFYFAMHVHQASGVPLGLVGAYWGGTGIDPWTPREGTASRADLKDILDCPVSDNWDGVNPESFFRFNRKEDQPSVLFNEMVNPWCPFAMKGLVWYQGCTNSREPQRYCSKMHALYNGWAQKFENPDMRLYFVQLAPWGFDGIAKIQEAQAQFAREQPKSGMAVINDVGNLSDIHPNEKGTVGLRLARMALKRDYGFTEIEDCSPTLKAWRIEDDSFVLDFNHAKRLYVYTRNYSADAPFEVAGADGVFKPAKIANAIEERIKTGGGGVRTEYRGRIDGGTRLIVKSDEVRQPVRLRYCHSYPWLGTVYNEANLPLGAFHVEYNR